jgi:hypothetical protein
MKSKGVFMKRCPFFYFFYFYICSVKISTSFFAHFSQFLTFIDSCCAAFVDGLIDFKYNGTKADFRFNFTVVGNSGSVTVGFPYSITPLR